MGPLHLASHCMSIELSYSITRYAAKSEVISPAPLLLIVRRINRTEARVTRRRYFNVFRKVQINDQ